MQPAPRQLILAPQPDFFSDAQQLMHQYFAFQLQASPDAPPWEQQSLLVKTNTIKLTPQQLDAAFPDMHAYMLRCREDAVAILTPRQDMADLYRLRQSEQPENYPGFLERVLLHMAADTAEALTLKDFSSACLWQLTAIVHGLPEEPPAELQPEALLPAGTLDMGQVFNLVSQAPMDDTQRMLHLGFFQQLPAWYERMREALMALEAACRRHFPLVEQRFLSHLQALKQAGDSAAALQWLRRSGTDLNNLRPEDPVELRTSLLGFNRISFRLTSHPQLPLFLLQGILFEELSALAGERGARDLQTERQLRVLGDPTRLKIVRSLAQGEKFVQQLADDLGLTPGTLSHHLSTLWEAMLVGVNTRGRRNYYHLKREELSALAEDLAHLANTPEEA